MGLEVPPGGLAAVAAAITADRMAVAVAVVEAEAEAAAVA